jgi:hypothetical protein
MIFELQYDPADLFALPFHSGLIVIAEAGALFSEREIGKDRQPQGLRPIERIRAGADGIAAGRDQLLQMHSANRALGEIRLAVSQELISAPGVDDLFYGTFCHQGTAQNTQQRLAATPHPLAHTRGSENAVTEPRP